jgi:DNA-binding MarR family transcriptional regulator
VLIELTDEGRAVLDEAVAANTKLEREMLAGLDERETEQLGVLLRKLLRGLEPNGSDSAG